MMKYLVPFVTALIFTALFIFLLKFAANNVRWRGRVSGRHINKGNAFRVGGIAMIIAFNLSILLNPDLFISVQLFGVMLASMVILVIGVWDDVREVFWKTQFFYQVAAAIIVFIFGLRIYGLLISPFGGIIHLTAGIGIIVSVFLVIFWIVLLINSMNWLDGIDGLSGGIFFIGAITIFILSLRPEVNQPPVAILALILSGVTLSFLIFNFYPSIVIAGTSGSMFMGFALAALAIFAGTKVATAILVLSLPIIDFVWVIGERMRRGKSIFKADRNHLHYKLMDLGWSQRKIALYFYSITIMLAIVALNTRVIGKSITLFATVAIMMGALIFINKKLDHKQKN